jgi:hypothetical protein
VTRSQIQRKKQLEEAVEQVKSRSAGAREVRSKVCTGRGEQIHHVVRRSQIAGHHADLMLDSCHACHTYLHANPAEAYEHGWLKHGWEA